jgi:hypothetical protein
MAKIDVDACSVADVRAIAGIEADLHEVVKADVNVVLRKDAAAVAAQLSGERLWPYIWNSHDDLQ